MLFAYPTVSMHFDVDCYAASLAGLKDWAEPNPVFNNFVSTPLSTVPVASATHLCYWLLDKSSDRVLPLWYFPTVFISKCTYFLSRDHSCFWSLPLFSSIKPATVSSWFIFVEWEIQICLSVQSNSFKFLLYERLWWKRVHLKMFFQYHFMEISFPGWYYL